MPKRICNFADHRTMRIIHIEKRDEEKKRDEEVESLKIQLKELKPKSNCDCKGIEKQVATLTASVNSIQLKTNDLLAANQENRESAGAAGAQIGMTGPLTAIEPGPPPAHSAACTNSCLQVLKDKDLLLLDMNKL